MLTSLFQGMDYLAGRYVFPCVRLPLRMRPRRRYAWIADQGN